MLAFIFIIALGFFGFVTKMISMDTFYVMIAIALATSGICQEISKLNDKPTNKKYNDDKKE